MDTDIKRKLRLVQGIIHLELRAFHLLSDKTSHPRYKQIIANTDKEELMKRDIQTLLKRRETLNQRDSLTAEDIRKIFKEKKTEAISAFDWTELVHNKVAFQIVEELKKQLAEVNGAKTAPQPSNKPQNQAPQDKDTKKIMDNLTWIMDGINQLTTEMSTLGKSIPEQRQTEASPEEGDELGILQEEGDELITEEDKLKSILDEVGIQYETDGTEHIKTEEEDFGTINSDISMLEF